jgi:hypothetical protein
MSHPARRGSEWRHKGFGVLKQWQAGFAGIAVTLADVGDLAGNKNPSPTDGAEPALLAAPRGCLDVFKQARALSRWLKIGAAQLGLEPPL